MATATLITRSDDADDTRDPLAEVLAHSDPIPPEIPWDPSAGIDAARAHSVRDWIRRTRLQLAHWGYERKDRMLSCHTFASDAERWRVWMVDSLAWGFEEFEAGRPLYTFRALLQVVKYMTEVQADRDPERVMLANVSRWSDATVFMRNLVESAIKGEV